MAFGIEAIILVEIRLPSFRVTYYNQEMNEEYLRMNLDLIEEVQNEVLAKEESYKRKATKYHTKRVKNRQLWVGDLVLRRAKTNGLVPRKLNPIWEGPFKIASHGAYWLEEIAGKPLSHSWNLVI